MDLDFLRAIRLLELERALPDLPAAGTVLEIGGGAGWQAQALEARGYRVESIDVPHGSYRDSRVWPVREYDGETIPFPDASFDAVFSSNVLEHIPHVERFQGEILRVLRPGGVAVHLLPTAGWRVATSLTYYPWQLRRLLAGEHRRVKPGAATPGAAPGGGRLLRALVPPRHGAAGTLLTEVAWFSRFRWHRLFGRTGWSVQASRPARLTYTGSMLLGPALGLRMRTWLSYALGSACLIWVLRPGEGRDRARAGSSRAAADPR